MNSPGQRFNTVAFIASGTPEAREAYDRLSQRYGNAEPAKADVIVERECDRIGVDGHRLSRQDTPLPGPHS